MGQIGTVQPGRAGPQNPVMRWCSIVARDFKRHYMVYIMAIPFLAYYVIFHYMPMYGLTIAFKDFTVTRGIMGSPWVGLRHFRSFFGGIYAKRVITNTLLISFYNLLFQFPAPILLAIMLNELRQKFFKRVIQTITYIPHFISVMVLCGMILDFTRQDGLINDLIAFLGGERKTLLTEPGAFRSIYVISDIWQELGWGTIIYLSALTSIDMELYEAARIDGAGRFKQTIHITLPGIQPTIIILLIMRIGRMMSVGSDKVLLLYNESIYSTADVISTYTYRRGIINTDYSFAAAVGFFNSVINFVLVLSANALSRKYSDSSLF